MSMFTRLFLLLGLLTGLSLAAVAVLLYRNSEQLDRRLITENNRVGQAVVANGVDLVQDSVRVTHRKIVREKAKRLEGFFAEVARDVEMAVELSEQFLKDPADPAAAPPLYHADEVIRLRKSDPAFRTAAFAAKPYVMYHLAPCVRPAAIQDRMNRLRRLGGFFARTQNALAGCDSSYVGDAGGFILGYPGGGNPFPAAYDPRARPWYQSAVAKRGLAWTIYADRSSNSLVLTAAKPIRAPSPATQPAGVAAVDVRLEAVIAELFTVSDLQVSDAVLIDDRGHVRVSATYTADGVSFDRATLLNAPPASELRQPGFARALDQIAANPRDDAGVYWDETAPPNPVTPAPESAGVYVYAAIEFRDSYDANPPQTDPATAPTSKPAPTAPTSARATNPTQTWHYIVRLPKDSIDRPIVAIKTQIDGGTRDLSAAIERGASDAGRALIAIVVIALAAALTLAYFGARNTARPLVQMAGVARQIGEGNLAQNVDVRSRDEVGQLGRAINAMIVGLKQRNLLKDTFGQYVAPSVVNQVLLEGKANLGGARRVLTIFFSDLKGFTSISEQLSPETLVLLLNEYFDAMTKVILETEGTVDKYVGDAVVAFWGDPVSHADDAARACRAALEQIRRLESLWPDWAARGLPRLDMRIGLQTGEAIVGNVGSDLKLNYTVLGDTPNFASRLEGLNKVYGTRILIGQATADAAGPAIVTREIDNVAVVGKAQAVRVYELLAMAGDHVPPDRLAGYRAYESALAAYRARRWDDAERAAGDALAVLGHDKAADVLLHRVARYRVTPPPDNWDGSHVALEK